ncbi:MAG: hypothetical protein R2710_00610 [Acidimicrobiales bacterium]
MSTRHRADALRSDRADEILLRPDKDLRSKEHRKARHRATQELHTVADPEGEVFTRPKFDHPPRVKPKKKKKTRHWKTKAWKRRTIERRRRNLEQERLLQEAA